MFQFTHPGRGATAKDFRLLIFILPMFQFTHPGRGATDITPSIAQVYLCFNSRTPGGVRLSRSRLSGAMSKSFNSRTPGGVRHTNPHNGNQVTNVSIHAPREGCDGDFAYTAMARSSVSIHAPREGCDFQQLAQLDDEIRFNSRTPGGVRRSLITTREGTGAFQFTHPGRGATLPSIYSLSSLFTFQFTHPGRGATIPFGNFSVPLFVSIHAPREGCDSVVQSCVL